MTNATASYEYTLAYKRALADLRDRHPDEFAELLAERKQEVGVVDSGREGPPEGFRDRMMTEARKRHAGHPIVWSSCPEEPCREIRRELYDGEDERWARKHQYVKERADEG